MLFILPTTAIREKGLVKGFCVLRCVFVIFTLNLLINIQQLEKISHLALFLHEANRCEKGQFISNFKVKKHNKC